MKKRGRSSIRAILAAVFFGGFAGVSLLTFPAGVVPMAAAWLALHSLLVWRGKPGWVPLLACLAILLIKRTAWLPGVLLLLLALGIAAGLRLAGRRQGRSLPTSVHRATLALLWFAWLIAAIDSWAAVRTSRRPVLDPHRPVVCLGDSLTAYGYPDELAGRLAVPVVNMGRDGISTTDSLELLPAIRELHPQAVIVELGGHDYLRNHGEETCRRNLTRIIEECRSLGAEVVLVEVPRGIVTDPFGGLERRLARQHDLALVSDTTLRWFVLFGPYAPPGMWLPREWHLSDDGLHPNARGNELLARRVNDALVAIFGPQIERHLHASVNERFEQ
ncbi:MAG: lysophospholipase [Planctomycetaceae bacterium]|nr:lysophospholipase [Planctomycetaceae bacterium]